MQNKTPLSKFESLAQRLVEGSFDRFLGGQVKTLQIASKLARAVEDGQENGRCPDRFVVHVSPTDFDEITAQDDEFTEHLADYIVELAKSGELTLVFHPQIMLQAVDALRDGRIHIESGFLARPSGVTTQVQQRADVESEIKAAIVALDAYLVVEGHRQIPLDQPQISIGRKTENNVVLDSATVSRFHAQIRWRYGRFVLYDLSNRNGRTRVNGEAVTDYALKSGDVIVLSDVSMVYGEGRTVQRPHKKRSIDETQLKPPD